VPLPRVRDLLRTRPITTTERFDNQGLESLQAAAAKLERGQVFDAATQAAVRPPDWRKFQESNRSSHLTGAALGQIHGIPARPAQREI
jgi:hypothetical protein